MHRKTLNLFFLLINLILPVSIQSAHACTRILKAEPGMAVMVGRNMDWHEDMQTNLLVYPRHLHRQGNPPDPRSPGNWLSWDAKYGSIVATGYENFTTDGLNEAGLAVHILWLEDSDYGTLDPSKPALSQIHWTQFYLDNFKTVADAVRYTENNPFQVAPFYHEGTQQWGALHLVLDDSSGDSAIFEYLNGQLHIFHDKSYITATNEPSYDQQLANLQRYKVFGGTKPLPGKSQSKDRFVRATYYTPRLVQSHTLNQEVAGVLSVLNNVAYPLTDDYLTIWHIVSDLTHQIYYFQSTATQNLILVNLHQFDMESPYVMKLDLVNHPEYTGDMSDKFEPMSSSVPVQLNNP